jgi:hypothetical protein
MAEERRVVIKSFMVLPPGPPGTRYVTIPVDAIIWTNFTQRPKGLSRVCFRYNDVQYAIDADVMRLYTRPYRGDK